MIRQLTNTTLDGETISTDRSDVGADQLSSIRSIQAQINLATVGPEWDREVDLAPLAVAAVGATSVELQVSSETPLLLSDCALEHANDIDLGPWFPIPAQINSIALDATTLIFDFQAPEKSAFFRLAPSE